VSSIPRRLFIGAAALTLGAASGSAALALTPKGAPQGKPMTTVEPGDMTMGDPKAPVTVIEYASASCPHCAAFNNDVFPAFKARYIDTGRVFYVFREILTQPTNIAAAAFLVARCAPRGQYFPVVDAFFHAQAEIYEKQDLRTPLLRIAAQHGLNEKAVDACLSDKTAIKALNDRQDRYANRDGVNATPTFLIGDQRLDGEQTLDKLDAAIAAAEAKARPPHARHPARRRR
jgi:protein-disulfide isomerase